MKKLMSLVIVALFSSATFAQDNKMEAAPANAPTKMKHECYMMKEGALMHCMGEKAEAQQSEVKLRNGSIIFPDGTIKSEKGEASKLENGQCIAMTGIVGNCEEMHMKHDKMSPNMKMVPHDKAAPVKKEVK